MLTAPVPLNYSQEELLSVCRTVFSLSEVLLLRGDGNYTYLYLTEGRVLLASKNIGFYESLLPHEYFWRTHKTAIVNRNFIVTIHKREVVLCDGTRLEVARRRWKEMKNRKHKSIQTTF